MGTLQSTVQRREQAREKGQRKKVKEKDMDHMDHGPAKDFMEDLKGKVDLVEDLVGKADLEVELEEREEKGKREKGEVEGHAGYVKVLITYPGIAHKIKPREKASGPFKIFGRKHPRKRSGDLPRYRKFRLLMIASARNVDNSRNRKFRLLKVAGARSVDNSGKMDKIRLL